MIVMIDHMSNCQVCNKVHQLKKTYISICQLERHYTTISAYSRNCQKVFVLYRHGDYFCIQSCATAREARAQLCPKAEICLVRSHQRRLMRPQRVLCSLEMFSWHCRLGSANAGVFRCILRLAWKSKDHWQWLEEPLINLSVLKPGGGRKETYLRMLVAMLDRPALPFLARLSVSFLPCQRLSWLGYAFWLLCPPAAHVSFFQHLWSIQSL